MKGEKERMYSVYKVYTPGVHCSFSDLVLFSFAVIDYILNSCHPSRLLSTSTKTLFFLLWIFVVQHFL